jgi:tetratricopeptide (TPR) repeat protein
MPGAEKAGARALYTAGRAAREQANKAAALEYQETIDQIFNEGISIGDAKERDAFFKTWALELVSDSDFENAVRFAREIFDEGEKKKIISSATRQRLDTEAVVPTRTTLSRRGIENNKREAAALADLTEKEATYFAIAKMQFDWGDWTDSVKTLDELVQQLPEVTKSAHDQVLAFIRIVLRERYSNGVEWSLRIIGSHVTDEAERSQLCASLLKDFGENYGPETFGKFAAHITDAELADSIVVEHVRKFARDFEVVARYVHLVRDEGKRAGIIKEIVVGYSGTFYGDHLKALLKMGEMITDVAFRHEVYILAGLDEGRHSFL